MKSISRALIGAAVGASFVAFSAASASASIACVGPVCWHAHEKYDYPPTAGVVVHEDSWKAGPEVKFREHEGRGYWKGETWTTW